MPTDVVVAQKALDVESSLRRDFLLPTTLGGVLSPDETSNNLNNINDLKFCHLIRERRHTLGSAVEAIGEDAPDPIRRFMVNRRALEHLIGFRRKFSFKAISGMISLCKTR